MTEDARFEDAGGRALRLQALDAEDIKVVSSLVQDAIWPMPEMKWQASKRRFSLLINRFRWEEASGRGAPERVRALLVFDDVLALRSQGIDRSDQDLILSLLFLEWHPGEDGAGEITLVLAGDGALRLSVEAINISLQDVTKPYRAPSGRRPEHPDT